MNLQDVAKELRKAGRPFTSAEFSTFKTMWESGEKMPDILAALPGRSKGMLMGVVFRHALKRPGKPPKVRPEKVRVGHVPIHIASTTVEQRVRVVALVMAGVTAKEISIQTGIKATWVPFICPDRPVKAAPVRPAPKQFMFERGKDRQPPTPIVEDRPIIFFPKSISPVQLLPRADQCRYLMGKNKPWIQCDQVIAKGSYCNTHYSKCYVIRGGLRAETVF